MARLVINKHRERAISLALHEIDSHLGKLETKEQQDRMLTALIEKHELNILAKGNETYEQLTVPQYRTYLATIAGKCGKGTKRKNTTLQDLFMEGTQVIQEQYRARFDLVEDPATPNSEDEDDVNQVQKPQNVHEQKRPSLQGTTEGMADTNRLAELIIQDLRPRPRPSPSPIVPEAVSIKKKKRALSIESPSGPSGDFRVSKTIKSRAVASEPPTAAKEGWVVIDESPPLAKEDSCARTESHSTVPTPKSETGAEKPSRLLVKLSDKMIQDEMSSLLTSIQTFAHRLLADLGATGESTAEIVTNPQPELEQLYKRVFGEEWLSRARALLSANAIQTRELVEACTAAAVYNMALQRDLPWITPKQRLESLSEDESAMDLVLQDTGQKLRLHDLVWLAGKIKMEDPDFHRNTIRPHAQRLAESFFVLMNTQLTYLKSNKKSRPGSDVIKMGRVNDLTDIIDQALVLKGRWMAAPDYYHLKWPLSGANVGIILMEPLRTGEQQEVVFALTPLIQKRETQDVEWSVVCRTKVLSRPKSK